MIRTGWEIRIDRTQEQVFDFVADLRNGPSWNPDSSNVVLTSDGPVGHGSLFEEDREGFGRTVTTIDVDVLTAGAHTVTITARDNAGNVTTKAITFTIHPSAQGILNAVNDGAARGWISAAYKPTLVTQINNVIAALGKGNSAATKLRGFISVVQSGTAAQITPAFQTLLLNWANDLLARS